MTPMGVGECTTETLGTHYILACMAAVVVMAISALQR